MADRNEVTRFDPFASRRRSMADAMHDLTGEDDSGVVIGDDGSMQFGAITLLPTGLQINGQISEAEWLKVGGVLRKLQSSLQWLIGDLVLYGEREYGRTYQEIAGLFGYDVDSLYQFKWVASQVKFSMRIEKLSFTHHTLIAGLSVDEQRQWLRAAEVNDWSVSEMRKAMKKPGKPRTPSAKQLYARFESKALPALVEALDDLSTEQLEEAFKLVQAKFREAWDKKQAQPQLTDGEGANDG